MRNLKLLFFALLMLPIALQAQEKLNLAGVYEANVKDVISSKMMYAVLDFNNCAAKDFTQLFTEKTAQFKQLPEDFMNAKKLKRNFAGTTAAGFVKFREKTLFALTEEMKLTNPRMEQGMIVADWQNTAGAKGTCGIIVKDDNSIEFVGLTSLERSLSPDGLTVTCVEDRCLTDQPRAKGTPEGIKNYLAADTKQEAVRSAQAVNSSSVNATQRVSGVPAKPHRTANTILITVDDHPQTVSINSFNEGLAYVRTSQNGGFYMDKTGKRVFEYYPQQYEYVPRFWNGVAIDCIQFKTAILFNQKGEVLKKIPNVTKVTNFVDGIAAVNIVIPGKPLSKNQNVYMNTKGEIVFQNLSEYTNETLKEVRPMADSLVAYYSYTKRLWGYRDIKGGIVIKPQFVEAHDFSEGLAAVKATTNGGSAKWGYIDTKGNFIIQPSYSNEPGDFHCKMAYIQNKDDQYFYIDRAGKILSGAFTFASDFHNFTAFVQLSGGGMQLIDITFRTITKASLGMGYQDLVYYIKNDIYLGDCLLSPRGELLLKGVRKPFFEDLSATEINAYATSDDTYHCGYMNRKGEYVIEFVESKF